MVRFLADNPGWWLAHCHILTHQLGGMAIVFKEGENIDMPTPPNDFPVCGMRLENRSPPQSDATTQNSFSPMGTDGACTCTSVETGTSACNGNGGSTKILTTTNMKFGFFILFQSLVINYIYI